MFGNVQILGWITGSGGGGGGGTYGGASPSTVTVNGFPAGTNIAGMSYDTLFQNIYAPYQAPQFSSFSISGQSQVIEVGVPLSGIKTFLWAITNGANVQPNTVAIRDVTANTLIASGLANDGSEAVDIGVINNTAPISQSWRGEAQNTQLGNFQSGNFTVSSLYPIFYGKVASGGAAPGANRPVADQALIDSGTKIVANSNGTITLSFGSTSDDYIWFAIPQTSTNKTVWFIDSLNNGAIGGIVDPGGNLFPANDLVAVDSPTLLWNGITYRIYIANYQSAVSSPMELRNS